MSDNNNPMPHAIEKFVFPEKAREIAKEWRSISSSSSDESPVTIKSRFEAELLKPAASMHKLDRAQQALEEAQEKYDAVFEEEKADAGAVLAANIGARRRREKVEYQDIKREIRKLQSRRDAQRRRISVTRLQEFTLAPKASFEEIAKVQAFFSMFKDAWSISDNDHEPQFDEEESTRVGAIVVSAHGPSLWGIDFTFVSERLYVALNDPNDGNWDFDEELYPYACPSEEIINIIGRVGVYLAFAGEM